MAGGSSIAGGTNLNTTNAENWGSSDLVKEKTQTDTPVEAELETPEVEEETPEVKAGNLAERYKAKYGSDAMNDLQTGDAGQANQVYDKIKALAPDDFWATQNLGDLMTKAGHQENRVNIGNYTKDGGGAVDASIESGIDFGSVQSLISEKGWEGEKQNSIGQLGSALLAADAPEIAKPIEEEKIEKPASEKLSKAQAFSQAYEDYRKTGGAVEQMAGDLGARDEFLSNYKLNLQRRLEPGQKAGNDDLPAIQQDQAQQKRTKIAADIVGKGAGFNQF